MASALLTKIRRLTEETFSRDSFKWFDRSYTVDWTFASLAWILAWIIKGLPPFEREFSIDDPLIGHKNRPNQISGDLTWFLSLLVPLGTIGVIGLLRVSALEIHHGFLGLWAARGYNALITEALKNRVGRLRPDFLSRCKWDKAQHVCTGKLAKILDGRRSFPSGHSSTAFSGMTFLTLYLAGLTGAWCLSQAAPPRSFFGSRMARLWITMAPMAFATWVAVSRVEDYRHHKEDVIVGSLIGIGTATVSYLIYWPNPFALRGDDLYRGASQPRLVYRDETHDRTERDYDYELAGIGHGAEPV
ncbi:lipid phosphate phosphatase 1 [Cristinia sonorae]|uniref:Lipid phosphate phosphatase 1 n=1 Tax=Cristinia sonorae TaxID=1940300 RepID=A0A8K0UH33_9AGAR|nr:lipid phosphate phosphatase 1 [Cristinia sonorae]